VVVWRNGQCDLRALTRTGLRGASRAQSLVERFMRLFSVC
jgi:hypothetical protein